MKVLKNVIDIEKEGLLALLGENVTIFCLNYIYHGRLVGVNDSCVKLEDPSIVYETGKFTDKDFKDIQSLNVESFYVAMNCIESFGKLK